ncbi:MAG: peroxiredoxin Q/BCP [Maribacter sp.]|jgi:peroxiredoxin Q/BCP
MTHLKMGDKAPDFSGINQDEKILSLADYKGSKLVLYFYPKDSTPGCTAQACNLSDNYDALLAKGYKVLGVSPDSTKRHQNFIAKYNLPFDLLVDTELETIKAYGIWGLKKFMGKEYDGVHRTTFIIDENGVIEDIIAKVKTKHHTEQILG